jgi:hypothetical protein
MEQMARTARMARMVRMALAEELRAAEDHP